MHGFVKMTTILRIHSNYGMLSLIILQPDLWGFKVCRMGITVMYGASIIGPTVLMLQTCTINRKARKYKRMVPQKDIG